MLAILLTLVIAPFADAQVRREVGASIDAKAGLSSPRTDGPGDLATIVADGPIRRAAAREAARLGGAEAPSVQQSQSAAQKSWPAQHPVLTGFLIGAAIGAVLPMTDEDVRNGDTPPIVYSAVSAGMLGGIGALIGLLAF